MNKVYKHLFWKGGLFLNEVIHLFPPHLQGYFANHALPSFIEEIRVRIHAPIELITNEGVYYLRDEKEDLYVLTEEDVDYILNQLSEFSIYAFHEELKQGFITTKGGHRVGLGGQVVQEDGKVQTMKHVRFFNIRLARSRPGVALPSAKRLYRYHVDHTLIIGPPQSGKTTFLRDLARILSNGEWNDQHISKKVAIVDERSEIAACYQGIPSFDVGKRTDVLDRCPKAEGMMMMIRSMSPEVIIVDEIGREEDVDAILEAAYAGVTVICSVHGHSEEEMKKRPTMKRLFSDVLFKHILTLHRTSLGKVKVKERTFKPSFSVIEK
ncbi:stage III sporulation protein AA [Aliibacillus thermotolerans]|nr:stage III sporulation protein AA [Aliibacillus thermotolerans]